MTTNEENVHLILYEFKLQDIECPDDKISSSDYGNDLVKSLGDIFECTFNSIVVTGYRKVLFISLSSFKKMYKHKLIATFTILPCIICHFIGKNRNPGSKQRRHLIDNENV